MDIKFKELCITEKKGKKVKEKSKKNIKEEKKEKKSDVEIKETKLSDISKEYPNLFIKRTKLERMATHMGKTVEEMSNILDPPLG